MLEIDGVLIPISENEEEPFALKELLEAERSILLAHKQATSQD
jgi:hypothetical protein